MPLNTYNMTDLGYKILLDRYAQNDPDGEKNLQVGDVVVAIIDNASADTKQRREIGMVIAIDPDEKKATIRLHPDDNEITIPIKLIDRVLESKPEEVQKRVARGIASVETTDEAQEFWRDEFEWLMQDWKFVPGGRILTSAGTEQNLSAFNCFVLESPHDSRGGIMKTLTDMAETMSRGGGVGLNISTLRPKNSYVKGVNGRSSGAVSWGALYSYVTGLIEQAGCFAGETRIATDKGLIPIKEIVERMEAGETFYAQTHEGMRKITDKFHNGVKPLFRVTTTKGYSVDVTANHPMLYMNDDGKIVDMRVDHMVVGNNVLVSPIDAQADTLALTVDTVQSIEPLGEAETYDLTVEHNHFISGNGVYTGNSRRGALMLIINDWHPDVMTFINSKRQAGHITNANISVGLSDKFMDAVKNDTAWELVFPDTSHPAYDDEWDGNLERWTAKGYPVHIYETIPAKQIWNAIIESAWTSAEPGMWFRERSNKLSNSYYYPEGELVSTNPCVTGDTRVYTNKGMVKARDLFDFETDFSVAIDSRFGEGKFQPSTRVFMTGVKEVYTLTTKEGYKIRATKNHRVMTPAGWKEIGEINIGDKVHIANQGGGFGTSGNYEMGAVLGWLVGDGSVNKRTATLSFWDKEQSLAIPFRDYVRSVVRDPIKNRQYSIGAHAIVERQETRVTSTRLKELAQEHGITPENKHRVPESVWQGNEDMQRGFISALLGADGSVQGVKEKGLSVRLSQSKLSLLEEVQMLLLNFGIASKIYKARRKAQEQSLPDGKGGHKQYWCQANHELVISKQNLLALRDRIGIIVPEKQARLIEATQSDKRGLYQETYVATVVSIERNEQEEVFDMTVPTTHSFIGNGIVLHNCGEQGLSPNAVCNLGAINLSKLWHSDAGSVDWKLLRRIVHSAVRFLDNVINWTPYHSQANEIQQKSERRIGLGIMGLADLMIKAGIKYGSEEGAEFTENLFNFMATEAYYASSNIAAEKGAFKFFDAEKLLESGFMKNMPNAVHEVIRERGLRNVTLLTVAPTGTIGILANVSTGIEPYFSWKWYRQGRLGYHEENAAIVREWLQENNIDPEGDYELPDYFVTAMDLSPIEHVRIQAAAQKWVDSAISKTCNAPNDYTLEQTSELYMYMYDQGCKGGTIYRDGSRSEQVLHTADKKSDGGDGKDNEKNGKNGDSPHTLQEIREGSPNGNGKVQISEVAMSVKDPGNTDDEFDDEFDDGDDDDENFYEEEEISLPSHPSQMHSILLRGDTPFGTAFITIAEDPETVPYALFIAIGKSGSDLHAQAESMGRTFSLAIQAQPVERRLSMLKILVEQNRGIGGARSIGLGPKRVSSFPDAVAKLIQELYLEPKDAPQLAQDHLDTALFTPGASQWGWEDKHVTIPSQSGDFVVKAETSEAAESDDGEVTTFVRFNGGNTCPGCGNATLLRLDGCSKCNLCGHSEC